MATTRMMRDNATQSINLPNIISIFRFFVTFYFIYAVYQGWLRLALYLFLIQGISDLLDGFIARVMGWKTELGAYLDPIADKTMLVAAFVMLYIVGIIPLWLAALVLGRDIVIAVGYLILYHYANNVKPRPTIFGKITTALQIATILYALWSWSAANSVLREYNLIFFYATALATIISGTHYLFSGIATLKQQHSKL
ncbi:MAG: CDP-diacylglycerol--glycerol-3-phosphate 3-phosphatidyltransferase [Deltaproteobacteria bacterium]|nr:CDP-diacylglycerol--glycerol-3-phosphate 3-phosphatidyltransferase [Deltaproteobacteria bacterium]